MLEGIFGNASGEKVLLLGLGAEMLQLFFVASQPGDGN